MHKIRIAIVTAGAAVLLAACSSSSPSGAPATNAPANPTASAAPTVSSSGVAVTTRSSPVGTILVDNQGRTLYQYSPDTAGKPTCSGVCAGLWPALTTSSGAVLATGAANATLVHTVPALGGGTQVTYQGHPLYRFSGDVRAGSINGQGMMGIWYVTNPAGARITTPLPPTGGGGATPTPTTGGGIPGY